MTRYDDLQTEIEEIYRVLRRDQPDASVIALWNEALSLHSDRYSSEVRPGPDDETPPSHTTHEQCP